MLDLDPVVEAEGRVAVASEPNLTPAPATDTAVPAGAGQPAPEPVVKFWCRFVVNHKKFRSLIVSVPVSAIERAGGTVDTEGGIFSLESVIKREFPGKEITLWSYSELEG